MMRNSLIPMFFSMLAGLASSVAAQPSFPVSVRVQSNEFCAMEATSWSIDPVSGRATLVLPQGFSCNSGGGNFPEPILSLSSQAQLAATPLSVESTAVVSVQFSTGATSPISGLRCEADGAETTLVEVISGWTGDLCTDCGSLVNRSVSIRHTGGGSSGSIRFKAKCTYRGDPAHPRITTVLGGILSSAVTVARLIPECTAVEQLADARGLTTAMRQTGGTIFGGVTAGTGRDFTTYTSVFGFAENTAAAGTVPASEYGFPGTNAASIRLALRPDRFTALKFRAPNSGVWLGRTGAFSFQPGQALVMAAIAPCPGQFFSDANFPMQKTCVGRTEMDISWRVSVNVVEACQLEPGRSYYLNLIHANGSDLLDSSCSTALGCNQYVRRILSN